VVTSGSSSGKRNTKRFVAGFRRFWSGSRDFCDPAGLSPFPLDYETVSRLRF
jgi:hypothetical protein